MVILATFLGVAALVQQPPATPPEPELAVISARLGDCSADFTVIDEDRRPVYAAIVHVRIRYGFMSLKRMDLEVGTDSNGRARVEGLPAKARPLTYDVSRAGKEATVEQDLSTACQASYEVLLK
jgi:hypothetical protein